MTPILRPWTLGMDHSIIFLDHSKFHFLYFEGLLSHPGIIPEFRLKTTSITQKVYKMMT